MDEYFQRLKQEAEKDDTGLTNDVFFTKKGTVVKTYSRYPLTSFLDSFTELLNGRINYISRDERMSNEIEVKKLIREQGFGTAQVVEVGEESIEFEKVPGIDGFNFLKEASEQDSQRLGQEVGNFLYQIHLVGAAMNDFRLSNIHVGEDLELYYLDHEYSKTNANQLTKKIDQLALFSSARQTGNFSSFLEGFKQSDSDVEALPLILSVFMFGGHALLLERDMRKFVKGMKSVFIR